ncbi:hypothetical protein [Salinisphaera sp. T31B1]|uniref:hypothetical protein n=1 Tax=Salinisphaera sp. T31B1 TaxID=727963 RepID=UPI00333E52F8
MKNLFIVLALAAPIAVAAKPSEQSYTDRWCTARGGETKVVLADRTRPDCVTDTHAIEVDFSRKFYEAIGQSLWYSFQTNKRAGILLIIDPADKNRYLYRLNSTIDNYDLPIDVWTVTQ